jgi:hypothetical protein
MPRNACKHNPKGLPVGLSCDDCFQEDYDASIQRDLEQFIHQTPLDDDEPQTQKPPAKPPAKPTAKSAAPVKGGARAVPPPVLLGVALLQRYLKLNEVQFHCVLTAAVTAGIPAVSKPILFFTGETNTGKTTRAEFTLAAARIGETFTPMTLQREANPFPDATHLQDHMLAADAFCALLYDDIELSASRVYKTLCLTSTGGGMRTRELYKNKNLVQYGKSVLVIYTGLSAEKMQPDLRNRHIILKVEPVPDSEVVDEDLLLRQFCDDLPKIHLAVSWLRKWVSLELQGVRPRPNIPRLLRLRTYARAGVYIGHLLGWTGFDNDYAALAEVEVAEAFDADAHTYSTIVDFLKSKVTTQRYEGTTAEIYVDLVGSFPEFENLCRGSRSFGRTLRAMQRLRLTSEGILSKVGPTAQGTRWEFWLGAKPVSAPAQRRALVRAASRPAPVDFEPI